MTSLMERQELCWHHHWRPCRVSSRAQTERTADHGQLGSRCHYSTLRLRTRYFVSPGRYGHSWQLKLVIHKCTGHDIPPDSNLLETLNDWTLALEKRHVIDVVYIDFQRHLTPSHIRSLCVNCVVTISLTVCLIGYNLSCLIVHIVYALIIACQTSLLLLVVCHTHPRPNVIMRPSSLGGGRILRRTLSVRLSVRPSRYRCHR